MSAIHRNTSKFLFVTLTAVLLAGCNAVYSTKMLGDKPLAISAADWDGVWTNKDGAVTVKTLDEQNGVIQAAWIEEDDNTKELKMQPLTIHLRETGGWVIANVESTDEPGLYSWGRFKRDGDQVTVWGPDIEKFKVLVTDGTLPGEVRENGDVVLKDLSAEQVQLIVSSEKGVLLNWENPGFLIRLGK